MAPPSFGSFHLARILGNYMERYPEVAIEMILTDRAPDLFEEGLDLAIWIGKLEESNLIARKLATTRSVVCGSPEYFAHKGIPKTPADLAQHNCLTFSTRTPYSDWKFMLNGKITTLHPMGTFRSNSADPLRIASINNCGLVQLPTYIVGLDIQSGRLQPVLENFEPEPLAINVVYIHRRHLSTKARTFVDFISEQFQPVPYWEKWIREN
jgi:DNA-binding transcriptional LysR family regulator